MAPFAIALDRRRGHVSRSDHHGGHRVRARPPGDGDAAIAGRRSVCVVELGLAFARPDTDADQLGTVDRHARPGRLDVDRAKFNFLRCRDIADDGCRSEAATSLSRCVATSSRSSNASGMCYQPAMTNLSLCDFTQADVDRDMQLVAQLTPRVRMYSAVCGQQRMALDAISRFGLNVTMWLGVQVKPSNASVYASESVDALDLIKAHPSLVEAAIVGNEPVALSHSSI